MESWSQAMSNIYEDVVDLLPAIMAVMDLCGCFAWVIFWENSDIILMTEYWCKEDRFWCSQGFNFQVTVGNFSIAVSEV